MSSLLLSPKAAANSAVSGRWPPEDVGAGIESSSDDRRGLPSLSLEAGMIVILPQGMWHQCEAPRAVSVMTASLMAQQSGSDAALRDATASDPIRFEAR